MVCAQKMHADPSVAALHSTKPPGFPMISVMGYVIAGGVAAVRAVGEALQHRQERRLVHGMDIPGQH